MADRDGSSFLWFLAGLGVGAVVGVLYAPKAGDEMRETIRSKAQESADLARQQAPRARTGLRLDGPRTRRRQPAERAVPQRLRSWATGVQRDNYPGSGRGAAEECVAIARHISSEEQPMNDNLLTIFIAVTAGAVVIQAGILVGLYLSVRKSTAKMDALANELKEKALPTLETVQSFIVEVRPRIETIADNVSDSSTLIKAQLERLDATLTDVLDRTRLQVIRADELLSRTMDRVEETSEIVHKTVVSPLRQVSGVMNAIYTGVEVFLGNKRRGGKNGMGVPQDEMFI